MLPELPRAKPHQHVTQTRNPGASSSMQYLLTFLSGTNGLHWRESVALLGRQDFGGLLIFKPC